MLPIQNGDLTIYKINWRAIISYLILYVCIFNLLLGHLTGLRIYDLYNDQISSMINFLLLEVLYI